MIGVGFPVKALYDSWRNSLAAYGVEVKEWEALSNAEISGWELFGEWLLDRAA